VFFGVLNLKFWFKIYDLFTLIINFKSRPVRIALLGIPVLFKKAAKIDGVILISHDHFLALTLWHLGKLPQL
jgi:hypothetical protein